MPGQNGEKHPFYSERKKASVWTRFRVNHDAFLGQLDFSQFLESVRGGRRRVKAIAPITDTLGLVPNVYGLGSGGIAIKYGVKLVSELDNGSTDTHQFILEKETAIRRGQFPLTINPEQQRMVMVKAVEAVFPTVPELPTLLGLENSGREELNPIQISRKAIPSGPIQIITEGDRKVCLDENGAIMYASARLEQHLASPALVDAVFPQSPGAQSVSKLLGLEEADANSQSLIKVTTKDFPFGPIRIITSGDKRVYLDSKDVVVYASENNSHSSFDRLAGFLSVPGRQPEFAANSPVADVAFYGTINSNLPGNEDTHAWMDELEAELHKHEPSLNIFNPNLHTDVQKQTHADGVDMAQFARESKQLFGAEIIVMKFEPKRGGLGLAELRMGMLAAAITGHKLIVQIDKPDTNIDVQRSRAIAEADIRFFKDKFGDRLDIDFIGMEEGDVSIKTLADMVMKAREARSDKSEKVVLPINNTTATKPENIALSGSSATPSDLARRMELIEQMTKRGHVVTDTYVTDYDGNPVSNDQNERLATMYKSRTNELNTLFNATDHVVYVGNNSISQYGQLTTVLLMTALNGSSLRGLLLGDRGEYGASTYRSHQARLLMNYDLAKVMSLIDWAEGVAPELQGFIRVLTDAIDPVIESFAPAE